MYFDSLLDTGSHGLASGLAGAALALISVLVLCICLPVLVLAVVLGAALGGPAVVFAHVAPVLGGPPVAVEPPASPSSALVVDVARRYMGIRYVFGGTNPAVGLDCSGLVQLVYRQVGMSLPRTAQQQYDASARVTRDQLQPGDLVFFARTYADPNDWVTHVGIYIGNGQQINAPTEGQVVSIQPVFTGFWGAHFVGGGRVARR